MSLEEMIRAIVREELRAAKAANDGMIAHDAWEVPPPGEDEFARARRLRRWAERARRGAIPGAVRRGKRWFATRSAIVAYFNATEPEKTEPTDEIEAAALASARRRRRS